MPNLKAKVWPGRLAGALGGAWTTLFVSAASAYAATAEHAAGAEQGGAHGGGGLPQLDPSTFAPQLVWLAISFAALYYLMSKLALPRVAEVLEARQERISNDLDKANALKDETSSVIAAYEKAVADARAQAQGVMGETSAAMEETSKARQGQFMADLNDRVKAAEGRIQAAREAAMGNVRQVASEIAQDVVAKVAGLKAAKTKADEAVQASTSAKEPV